MPRFGFTGHQRGPQQEPDLYYAQQRWYNAATGRFISEDPLLGNPTNPPSLHRYLYAFANPTVFVDPLGLASCDLSPTGEGLVVCGIRNTLEFISGKADDVVEASARNTAEKGFLIDTGGPTPTLNPSVVTGVAAQIVKDDPLIGLGGAVGILSKARTTLKAARGSRSRNADLPSPAINQNDIANATQSASTRVGTGAPVTMVVREAPEGAATNLSAQTALDQTRVQLRQQTDALVAESRISSQQNSRLALPGVSSEFNPPQRKGTLIVSDELPVGFRFLQAVGPRQKSPGAFGTRVDIPSLDFVRERLGVIPEFKQDVVGSRVVEVVRPARAQFSIIGPQPSKALGREVRGGEPQIQIIDFDRDDPFVEFVSDVIPFREN